METVVAIGQPGMVASTRTAGQATTWKPMFHLPWLWKDTVNESVYFSKIGFSTNKGHIIVPGT